MGTPFRKLDLIGRGSGDANVAREKGLATSRRGKKAPLRLCFGNRGVERAFEGRERKVELYLLGKKKSSSWKNHPRRVRIATKLQGRGRIAGETRLGKGSSPRRIRKS